MNKIGLFLLVACIAGFSSCGPDSEVNTETEKVIKGRPTVFELYTKNQDSYHYINENQLSKIVYSDATIMDVHYSENDITACTFTHKPPKGGPSRFDFEKVGNNRINVTLNSQNNYYVIHLDANGLPVSYNVINNDNEERVDKEFTFLPNSNQIHQKKDYFYFDQNEPTVKRINTYTYEYDNNPGTTSKINCPVWFRLFFSDVIGLSVCDKELSNYYNNVIKENVTAEEMGVNVPDNPIFEYHYTYDDEGYPSSVIEPRYKSTITIKY